MEVRVAMTDNEARMLKACVNYAPHNPTAMRWRLVEIVEDMTRRVGKESRDAQQKPKN